ncbi:MAG: OmpA family protein [Azoarcus sp.]|nr:OmpA family protein [Azoarcus sp.]
MKTRTLVVTTLTAALAACSSVPERNSALDHARDRYATAQANQQINALAPDELKAAGESLRVAEEALAGESPITTIDHLAYMTSQRVVIAEQTASARASQAITAGASAERDAMQRSARAAEAEAAQRQRAQAQQDARNEAMRTAEAEAAQRQLAQSQQDVRNEAMRLNTRTAEADAVQRQRAQTQQDAQVQLAQSQQDVRNEAMRLNARTADADAAQRQLAQSQQDVRSEEMRLNTRTAEADAVQRQRAQTQQDAQVQLAQSQQDVRNEATRLSAREAEADAAQRRFAQSQQDAQVQLAQSQQDAQRDAVLLSRSTAETDAAQRQLAQSQQEVQRGDARIRSLEAELRELNAKETPRGMVVTLGDLLFRTGQSQLEPASANNIAKLADFFKRNPERTAMIEGHTDNVGAAAANQALSEGRANAVMTALQRQGVPANRLRTRAFGQDNPVASNDNPTGRQMNRRVEIVFAP